MAHIKTLHSRVALNIITGLSEQMPFTSRIQQKRPAEKQQVLHGAENGTQTRDPQLGRLVLYRLSYFRSMWGEQDSNLRRRCQLSYSQPQLATLVSPLCSKNSCLF